MGAITAIHSKSETPDGERFEPVEAYGRHRGHVYSHSLVVILRTARYLPCRRDRTRFRMADGSVLTEGRWRNGVTVGWSKNLYHPGRIRRRRCSLCLLGVVALGNRFAGGGLRIATPHSHGSSADDRYGLKLTTARHLLTLGVCSSWQQGAHWQWPRTGYSPPAPGPTPGTAPLDRSRTGRRDPE